MSTKKLSFNSLYSSTSEDLPCDSLIFADQKKYVTAEGSFIMPDWSVLKDPINNCPWLSRLGVWHWTSYPSPVFTKIVDCGNLKSIYTRSSKTTCCPSDNGSYHKGGHLCDGYVPKLRKTFLPSVMHGKKETMLFQSPWILKTYLWVKIPLTISPGIFCQIPNENWYCNQSRRAASETDMSTLRLDPKKGETEFQSLYYRSQTATDGVEEKNCGLGD